MAEDRRFSEVNLSQALLGFLIPAYPGRSSMRLVRGYQGGCLLKWSRAHVSLLRWF